MKNIIVLVSGGGTNLQALINASESGNIPDGKITCVISSREGVYALERAKKHGIPTRIIPRKNYSDSKTFSKDLLKALKEEKADLIIYAGFMTIVDECVAKAFPNQMINVHPALIPSFCGKGFYGLHVHEAALKKGVKVTGATIHFVTEVCDGGPIILQKAVEVKSDDTPELLQKRVMEEAEWDILPRAAALFCAGKIVVNGNTTTILD